MLPLVQFTNPLVMFQGGSPPHYRRKYPILNQTFPLPPRPMPKYIPRLPLENIRQYPADIYGRRLFYVHR